MIHRINKNLLWVDCSAGAIVGMLMFALSSVMVQWYRLPLELIYFMGTMNLVYACYSFSLAMRKTRPLFTIILLAAANIFWAILCIRWCFEFWESASPLGIIHLGLEAIFVGGLGMQEWRERRTLITKISPQQVL